MKQITKILSLIFLIGAINFAQAQQTPAKSKTKTTKKAPAKAGTAKKAPKAAKKDKMVYLCAGSGSGTYTYHSRKTCATLAKCKGKITMVSKSDAIYSYGKEPCKNCN